MEKTLITNVKGIYCHQCSEIITEHLMQTRGVIDANVSYFRAELSVRYDPEIVSEAKLREKLIKVGYAPCEKGARGSNPILNAIIQPFHVKK